MKSSQIQDGSQAAAIPKSLWIATLLIASQSFLYGYVMVALNPCLVTGKGNDSNACYHGNDDGHCPPGAIYNDLNLTTIEASIANAVFVIGAWIGSIVGSSPSEYYGRRKSLLGNGIFFLIGALLSASGNFVLLFLGRLISGFGVGVVSCLAPVLLSEIATKDTRGTITTMHQTMLTLGILIAGLLGYGFVQYVNHGWQYIQVGLQYSLIQHVIEFLYFFQFCQAFQFLPVLFVWVLQHKVPESPKWLVLQNRMDEAAQVLVSIREPGYNVEDELKELASEAKQGVVVDDATWGELFQNKKSLIIGGGLMLFQVDFGFCCSQHPAFQYASLLTGILGHQHSHVLFHHHFWVCRI